MSLLAAARPHVDTANETRLTVTSSTKPEVLNVLHCRQRKTEPLPQVTCIENFAKFECFVFEICERICGHTDTFIAMFGTPPGTMYVN